MGTGLSPGFIFLIIFLIILVASANLTASDKRFEI